MKNDLPILWRLFLVGATVAGVAYALTSCQSRRAPDAMDQAIEQACLRELNTP